MSLLEVKNLGISFGGLRAVDGFHISIEKGQLYGLIGPNGAGKTTVFNMLTGVYTPNDGSITLDGVDITGKKTIDINKAGIARTFQNIRLFSKLSVFENVIIAKHMRAKQNFFSAALHLNGHRLKGTIQLADGAALTVHGKGMIQATARSHSRAGCPIYARGQGCRVDLYGGRYLGGAGSCAVCAAAGQVILHGGLYAVKGDSADHLLYSVGDGAITVEGGRFVGFDPAACLAPGRTTAAQETDKGILYVVKEL